MNEDYVSMLDLTFEIEGLLALLQKRDDDAVAEIKSLATQKAETLVKMLKGESSGSEGSVSDELKEIASMPDAPLEPALNDTPVSPQPLTEQSMTANEEPAAPEVKATPDYEQAEQTEQTEDNPVASGMPHRGQLTFTLNDKFRFRRELFANNDMEFSDTLNVIGAMNSFAEAEDYLYNDLCWDPSNDDVAAFMAIIADYFGK